MTAIQIAAGRKELIVLQVTPHQSGGYGLRTSQCRPLFYKYFLQFQKNNNGKTFSGTFALRLYNKYNHAHPLAQHMQTSLKFLPNSILSPSPPKQGSHRVLVLRTPVSAIYFATDKIQKLKIELCSLTIELYRFFLL